MRPILCSTFLMGIARISLDKKYKIFDCFQQDVDQTLPLGKIVSIQDRSSHRDQIWEEEIINASHLNNI